MQTLSPTTLAARQMDSGDMVTPSLLFWKGRTFAILPGDSEATARYKHQRLLAFQRDLRQGFVPAENMIRGVVANAHDYVLGSEPTWTLVGTADVVKGCEDILTPTWNGRNLHSVCQEAMRTRIREGLGAIRVRIPSGGMVKAQAGQGDPVEAGSQWLRFEALTEPERLTIIEDEDSLTLKAECDLGKDKDGKERGIERAFIDPVDGFTVLTLEVSGETTTMWRLDLGGLLPYVQIRGPALITQGMIDNQVAANLIMTSAVNNSELAGQIMEHFHNMTPQLDPQGKPLPAVRGPGGELYTQDTVAVQTMLDADGRERETPVVLKGDYQRHGPVSSQPLEFTLQACRYNIYTEATQGHYLIVDKASATGEARKVAMSSFFKSLAPFRTDAVRLIRQLFMATLAMAHALCKQPIPDVQIEPALTDTLVEPTVEERRQDLAEQQAGLISMERARARQAILNSEAEQGQIDKERAEAAKKAPVPNPMPVPSPVPNPRKRK